MTRAALYARYSSDNQSEASIEDQFRLCRDHARRERWEAVGWYEDAAISGASTILRPGIQRLMRDAQHGKFNILLAEALDRISRDQADVATLYKQLKFAGVSIVTLAEGEISELHVGLKGTMNALFLKDLAMKTHRGLRGRVEKGKAGGGLCYGYRVIKKTDADGEPIRGDREIVQEEAEIIRRIFREFAGGKSPKAIAVDLNREAIPGPLGRAWGDTSVRGHRSRGTGIINNELYAGVLVWNRMHFIKDPSTGKRVSRVNPESEWIRTEVPHLRIVDDGLWNAARARQKQITEIFGPNPANTREGRMKRVHLANRPVALLSGLMTCGCCGGRYGIITTDRYGCLNHHRRGTCDNNRTITRDKIEGRVLVGLKERLVSSEAVAEAVRAYAEEMNRLNRNRRAQAQGDRKALAKVEKAIGGIIAAIEDGMYQPSMKARMDDLERQKAEITARMAEAPADIPDVHPNIANLYRLRVERFAEALDDPDGGRQAAEALRSLIGEVVLTPGDKRGEVHAELRGELMGILDFARAEAGGQPIPFMPAVEASPRNQLHSLGETIKNGLLFATTGPCDCNYPKPGFLSEVGFFVCGKAQDLRRIAVQDAGRSQTVILLISPIRSISNLKALDALPSQGLRVRSIPLDLNGPTSIEAVAEAIGPRLAELFRRSQCVLRPVNSRAASSFKKFARRPRLGKRCLRSATEMGLGFWYIGPREYKSGNTKR